MKITEVEIGTKLELELYNNMGDVIKPSLVSQMEWMDDENTAYIAAPIHEGVIYPVHIDTVMNVYLIVKDDLYKFKSKVLKRGIKDNIAFLKIEVLSDFEKIQRRQFFRFEYIMPLGYRVVESFNPEYNEESPYKSAITKDLSGGGIGILLEEKIEREEYVECKMDLQLENMKTISFIGKVVRLTKRKPEDKYLYEVGISFRTIEYKDREALISFIFQEQRKLIKKGLI